MPPLRQVEQRTFDKIVQESIDDFGLSQEEAIEDAIEQLKKAGITDFSNISTRPTSAEVDQPEGNDSETSYLAALRREVEVEANDPSPERLVQAVNDVLSVVTDPAGRIGDTADAVALCASALSLSVRSNFAHVVPPCCQLVSALCSKDDANRHLFTTGATDGISALKTLVRSLSTALDDTNSDDTITKAEVVLRAVSAVQRRNERAKRRMAAGDTPEHLIEIFQRIAKTAFDTPTAFSLICSVLFQLLAAGGDGRDVDPRVGIAEAFPRARAFAGEHTVTESGLRPLSNGEHNLICAVTDALAAILDQSSGEGANRKHSDKTTFAIIRDCLSVATSCAQSDEMCKLLDDGGVIASCADVLMRYGSASESITVAALQLLSKLAQRDSCKTEIHTTAMRQVRDATNQWSEESERVVTAFCAFVAQICLRRPDLSRQMASSGVAADIVQLMTIYAQQTAVLRVACYALRNICSRDEQARLTVRKDGTAERLLRDMMKKWPREADAAYYALKEMDVLADNELRWDSRYGSRPSAMASVGKGIGGGQ